VHAVSGLLDPGRGVLPLLHVRLILRQDRAFVRADCHSDQD
jgi:hypothetical protein